jgi:hypothetical protein
VRTLSASLDVDGDDVLVRLEHGMSAMYFSVESAVAASGCLLEAVKQSGKQTEDVAAFGRGTYVYCAQHLGPHNTGWCTVGLDDKVGLGIKFLTENMDAAHAKCKKLGLLLHTMGDATPSNTTAKKKHLNWEDLSPEEQKDASRGSIIPGYNAPWDVR